ncbi:MAG: glycosyltransferase family 9 protein [Pyrinomonadaceae bacterium]|nr:glycosyltransferase family 9 protein [Pyrinomonadaceae bacterium]
MKPQNSQIDWKNVNRVLIIRLKSIGDTVLTTPSLTALRRFLPEAQIDVLLEDWAAPVLDGFEAIDNVISFKKDDLKSRLATAWQLRRNKYDVVFNLHGGTTSGFFVRATGAPHRVGYSHYRYIFFHNRLLSSSADFWNKKTTHSAEQQLALLGFAGIPVEDKPKSKLNITEKAENSVEEKLKSEIQNPKREIALIHPVAAFDTKQWATENFARIAAYLSEKGFEIVAVATKKEREVLEALKKLSQVSITAFDDLTLPEITALAAKAKIFIGNDSGIAHIAAAVQTPSIVIFGSSNRDHWRPWTDAPHEIVYEKFDCQPCAGYFCKQFSEPKCILSVKTESVIEAIERVLSSEK